MPTRLQFLISQSLAEEAPHIARLLNEGGYDTKWVVSPGNGFPDDASNLAFFPDYRQQLDAINEELREKVKQLERSNADLEQFAWAASHDLKEPLRTISGYTQLLIRRRAPLKKGASAKQGRNSKRDTQATEFASYIRQGVEKMGSLIDALLAYSRAMHQPLGPDRVTDAQSAAEDAVQTLDAAIEASGAVIEIHRLPSVCAEAAPLVQIFQNLVANALKYRHSETPPCVDISAVTHGGEVRFAVRDNGIGIASEHYDRIFEVFRRLHGEDYEGLGIGLAICKRLVERYGGRIWLDSELGAGSTFYFTLRAAEKARGVGRP